MEAGVLDMVSILVFLEPPLIQKKSKKEAKNADVSILVFLEPPLILSEKA